MSVTIQEVPAGTRRPGQYLTINTAGVRQGLPVATVKVMLLATKCTTGSATAAVPVQITGEDKAREYFGDGSPAALMVKALLEQYPYVAELWVCPLAEAGGSVAASGTLEFTVGELTAGTLYVYLGRHKIKVGVTADDDATSIATAVAVAVEANAELPFSAESEDELVTFTCKAKGTAGNAWVFYTEFTGSGLTRTLVQPASGATNADIDDALTAISAGTWDIIVAEWNSGADLDALATHLDTVSGAMEQRPGVGVSAFVGSVANATTLATARNSGRLTIGYQRGVRLHPYEFAAAYAALIASEPDVARPLNGLELVPGLPPDLLTDQLTLTEVETLLLNGCAPFEVVGNKVRIIRSVTTYVEDDSASDDDALLDLQTIRTLDYIVFVIRTALREHLARVKIADNAVSPNTTDPDKIRSLILGKLLDLERAGYTEKVMEWKDRLVVVRDDTNVNRVNANIPADVVDGLHVVAGSVNLILS